jgi:fused signal recognition particle receptor
VSGIFLAKLDGTAKGGIVLAICDELKIPITYIGTGEQIDDIAPFDASTFVEAIFS